MKDHPFMSPPSVYIEIGQSSLKAVNGDAGLEIPLERMPGGRLTDACKEQLILRLGAFLKKEVWQPRARALCAIGARGVSLRHLALPSSAKESVRQLLLLQIESEFPLPPDALAWGYQPLPDADRPGNPPVPEQPTAAAKQDFLVVAVKKEVLEEYSQVLSDCGVIPVFALAGMARAALWAPAARATACLDIGRNCSEFMSFENGVPTAVRILPWGGESITNAIAKSLGVSRDEAEQLKLHWALGEASEEAVGPKIQAGLEEALKSLAGAINGHWTGPRLYLSGKSARIQDLPSLLDRCLGKGVECECLEPAASRGGSSAIVGLQTLAQAGRQNPPLELQLNSANGTARRVRPAPWKWVAIAVSLAIGVLVLPFVEAWLLKARLSRKLVAIQADLTRLSTIDRELDFLRYLKQSQPPYLDALFLLAKDAPPGSRFDSLSMNRRGDLALRGSFRDSQQVVGFRSKLIESGFFANVTVEEQAPSPDRQKVVVRMSAQWKPRAARESLAIGPTAEEIEKAKTRPKNAFAGPFPGMGPAFPGAPPTPAGPSPAGPRRRLSPSSPSSAPAAPAPPMAKKE